MPREQAAGDEFRRTCIKALRNRFYKEQRTVSNVDIILHARVPIIKFTHVKTGLECDININSPLGIRNSNMLNQYNCIDPRFRLLGFTVKSVAKMGNINDASCGMLSSYALIMMVIHYLQQLPKPVLPCLQQLSCPEHPKIPVMESGWDTYFFEKPSLLPEVWKGENESSVGELLIGFFRYYTEEFDFKNRVVCVSGRVEVLTKEDKNWTDRPICMEDPFDHSHNLSKGVGIRAFRYIIENFRRARLHFATPLQGQSLDLASRSAEDASKVFFNPEKLASEEEAPGKPNCFSCGKPGHRSIACPDQVCFRCNKKGHRKIDCPNKKSLRLCHFCNEPGHERAQCPKNKDGGRRQRYGAGPRGFAKGARQRK